MLDKNFLTSFLKLNHAPENLSDDEVRAMLARAGWTQSEIEAAIVLLRSGVSENSLREGDSAATFRPGMEFNSAQLSQFLGVDIEIDPTKIRNQSYQTSGTYPMRPIFLRVAFGFVIVALSLAIATGMGFGFLYVLEIGPFRT